MSMRRRNARRGAAAIIGAVAASGLVAASAATLGGITANDLGAEYDTVAACDADGITVKWDPTYDQAVSGGPDYAVGDVDITGIDAACLNQNIKVELTDAAGAPLGEEVDLAAVTSPAYTVAFATPVNASAVEGIAVTIYE